MSEELEPMDPALRALLREGARPHVVPEDARARLLQSLAVAVAVPATAAAVEVASSSLTSASSAGAATTAVATKVAAVTGSVAAGKIVVISSLAFALGGAAGATAVTTMSTPVERVVYVERVVERASSQPVASTVAPLTLDPVPTLRAEDLPSTSPTTVVGNASPPVEMAREGSLVLERKLLDEARVAFARGDYTTALANADGHEKLHPRGQLAEERDALRVRILADMGEKQEARIRAARFRTRYPESMLGPAVEAAANR